MFCDKCGAENRDAANFCGSCGESVYGGDSSPASEYQPARGSNTNEADYEYYAEAVGHKKAGYYLPRFERFDLKGVSVAWHWPAFFVSFYWLLYRKMWGWALLYFFISMVITVIEVALPPGLEFVSGLLYVMYWAGIFVLFPMCANALYYRHVKKKIENVRSLSCDKDKKLRMVAAEGGTSSAAMVAVLIIVFIAVVGILAAIAIPAYQDYITRAKVDQGYSYGLGYKSAVEEYATQHQRWPQAMADIQNAGAVTGPNDIEVFIDNGVIFIWYVGGAVDGESIALVPAVNDRGQFVWECNGVGMDARHLPTSCRK